MKTSFALTFVALFIALAVTSCGSKTETTNTDSVAVDTAAIDTAAADTAAADTAKNVQ
jgi:ABC-type enterochelin transport system substrate-binding protein